MEKRETIQKLALPSVMKTLAAGFNLVAENIYLIFLPILIDLVIWLGPKIRVFELLSENVSQVLNNISQTAPESLLVQLKTLQEIALASLGLTNIFGAIGLFPLSVPSLMAGSSTIASPLENSKISELNSVPMLLLVVFVLMLIGTVLGCFYYSIIAQKSAVQPFKLTLKRFLKQLLNAFIIIVALFLGIMLLLIPISCVISLFTLLSPVLAQIILFIILMLTAWLIIPIFFSIHGVFLGANAIQSFKLSFNISQWFSSPTSFFLIAMMVISQGLNLIWAIPEVDSWLLLIGVAGHAFISTGLLASSFILYQNYLIWITENEELLTKGIIRK